ncbi:MAG: hypothetical protein FJW14_05060 [Acidimicrobiia bacterium]|nr:hypothetical protein [Acidimicrobiia bacterium]
MVQRLCTNGEHEILKCGVHGAAGVIAGLMAAYNIAACRFRRDNHLRVNALVYTLLTAYEVKHTIHHLNAARAATAAASASTIATPAAA